MFPNSGILGARAGPAQELFNTDVRDVAARRWIGLVPNIQPIRNAIPDQPPSISILALVEVF
jgi:hypothetical protein